MVPLTKKAQQPHRWEYYQQEDITGTCLQGSRDYSSEELKVSWGGNTWFFRGNGSTNRAMVAHYGPVECARWLCPFFTSGSTQDLERENRELRQSLSMKEVIRRLTEIPKGIQDMWTRNQSSKKSSPTSKEQHLSPTPPVPSPKIIYRESEAHTPKLAHHYRTS